MNNKLVVKLVVVSTMAFIKPEHFCLHDPLPPLKNIFHSFSGSTRKGRTQGKRCSQDGKTGEYRESQLTTRAQIHLGNQCWELQLTNCWRLSMDTCESY